MMERLSLNKDHYARIPADLLKETRDRCYQNIQFEQLCIDALNVEIVKRFWFQNSDEGQVLSQYMGHFEK